MKLSHLIARDLIGTQLPTLTRKWDIELFKQRHELVYGPGRLVSEAWPEANIHSEDRAARSEGLPGAVGSAPQFIAMIHRVMLGYFGDGWLAGGRIRVRMIKPVFVDDVTTAKVVVTGITEDESDVNRLRVLCRVRVDRRDGTPVMVGTASACIPD